jgi:outer membrane lipoprotein-sorting protein
MKLSKIILFTMLCVVGSKLTVAQEAQRTMTNGDVIKLAKSGIGEQTIILTIQKSSGAFDTSPEALIQLKTAGVSDAVLNAMLTSAPTTTTTVSPTRQDCSETLDKVLASVGTSARIASVNSSKLVGKSIVNRASGSSAFQLERVTIWTGSIHVSLQPAAGVASTVVITPEFNYLVSGKMTTAVPASVLQELESGLKLDLIYIAQHRTEYSCVLDGTEQIGNVTTAKLKVKSESVEGQFNADPTSGRLLRLTYKSDATGQLETNFSDWRLVDEINVPFKRHVVSSSGTTDVTLSEYHVNPATDVTLFQPPAGQVAASVTLKVLQSESVPYTVQTNGGISTACDISGSTSTSLTASTYGNTTYGTATSTPNLQMNCRSSDTTIRWTHVLNAMFVQASDGNAYIIACDRAWRWSKCTPLKAGDTFLAKRGDKGFVVQSFNGKSKEKDATYGILQSKSLHE